MINRRKEIRAKTKLSCDFTDKEKNTYKGKIRDLSKSGLKLVAKIEEFPIGITTVELSFHLPISNVDLTLKAEIRWQRLTDVNMEVGLEFVDLRPMHRLDIGQYISSALYSSGGVLNQRFGL